MPNDYLGIGWGAAPPPPPPPKKAKAKKPPEKAPKPYTPTKPPVLGITQVNPSPVGHPTQPVINLGHVAHELRHAASVGAKPSHPSKKTADPSGGSAGASAQNAVAHLNIDPMTGKPWSALNAAQLTNQSQTVKDYAAHPVTAPGFGLQGLLSGAKTTITNKEYDALRKAAAKGNRHAQQILDHMRYKAVGYPSLQQDLTGPKGVLTPFTNQITQRLPAVAANVQNIVSNDIADRGTMDAATQAVNTGLAQLDLSGQGAITAAPPPTPQTASYEAALNADVAGIPTINQSPMPGVPSISEAIKDMGTAAKQSNAAVPDLTLLNAILQRAQTNLVYYGATAPGATFSPFISSLLSQVVNPNTTGLSTAQLGALSTPSAAQIAADAGLTNQATAPSANPSNPAA